MAKEQTLVGGGGAVELFRNLTGKLKFRNRVVPFTPFAKFLHYSFVKCKNSCRI